MIAAESLESLRSDVAESRSGRNRGAVVKHINLPAYAVCGCCATEEEGDKPSVIIVFRIFLFMFVMTTE